MANKDIRKALESLLEHGNEYIGDQWFTSVPKSLIKDVLDRIEHLTKENENSKITAMLERGRRKLQANRIAEERKKYKKRLEQVKSKEIKNIVLQLEAEVDSSDKYIEEYDSSEPQRAYNQGLRKALSIVKGMGQKQC